MKAVGLKKYLQVNQFTAFLIINVLISLFTYTLKDKVQQGSIEQQGLVVPIFIFNK